MHKLRVTLYKLLEAFGSFGTKGTTKGQFINLMCVFFGFVGGFGGVFRCTVPALVRC